MRVCDVRGSLCLSFPKISSLPLTGMMTVPIVCMPDLFPVHIHHEKRGATNIRLASLYIFRTLSFLFEKVGLDSIYIKILSIT